MNEVARREECRAPDDGQCLDCGVFLPAGAKVFRVSESESLCPGCEEGRREADTQGGV